MDLEEIVCEVMDSIYRTQDVVLWLIRVTMLKGL
jgi:hypothetical protein